MAVLMLLVSPALALIVVVTLCALASTGSRRRPPRYGGRDFGLLVPVGRVLPWDQAGAARATLAAAGLRATLGRAGRGYDASGRPWTSDAAYVLVFPDDAAVAAEVLARTPR